MTIERTRRMSCRRNQRLVDRAGADQLEERDLGFEPGPVPAHHLEGPGHRAEGRRQGTARSVLEALTRLEHGLLADDAGTVDLLDVTRAVDDRPVAVDELDSRIGFVGDRNRVEEEPATGRRAAVLGRIACADLDADAAGHRLRARFEEVEIAHIKNSSSESLGTERGLRGRA